MSAASLASYLIGRLMSNETSTGDTGGMTGRSQDTPTPRLTAVWRTRSIPYDIPDANHTFRSENSLLRILRTKSMPQLGREGTTPPGRQTVPPHIHSPTRSKSPSPVRPVTSRGINTRNLSCGHLSDASESTVASVATPPPTPRSPSPSGPRRLRSQSDGHLWQRRKRQLRNATEMSAITLPSVKDLRGKFGEKTKSGRDDEPLAVPRQQDDEPDEENFEIGKGRERRRVRRRDSLLRRELESPERQQPPKPAVTPASVRKLLEKFEVSPQKDEANEVFLESDLQDFRDKCSSEVNLKTTVPEASQGDEPRRRTYPLGRYRPKNHRRSKSEPDPSAVLRHHARTSPPSVRKLKMMFERVSMSEGGREPQQMAPVAPSSPREWQQETTPDPSPTQTLCRKPPQMVVTGSSGADGGQLGVVDSTIPRQLAKTPPVVQVGHMLAAGTPSVRSLRRRFEEGASGQSSKKTGEEETGPTQRRSVVRQLKTPFEATQRRQARSVSPEKVTRLSLASVPSASVKNLMRQFEAMSPEDALREAHGSPTRDDRWTHSPSKDTPKKLQTLSPDHSTEGAYQDAEAANRVSVEAKDASKRQLWRQVRTSSSESLSDEERREREGRQRREDELQEEEREMKRKEETKQRMEQEEREKKIWEEYVRAEQENMAREETESEKYAQKKQKERIAKENERERIAKEEMEKKERERAELERQAKQKEEERRAREFLEKERAAKLKSEEERKIREREEQERLAKEEAEKMKETELLDQQRREKAEKEMRKEREEKERKEREEKERKEREEKERREREEKERREREEKERREREEKERREREEQEREVLGEAQQEQRGRERAEREKAQQEEERRKEREREEAERLLNKKMEEEKRREEEEKRREEKRREEKEEEKRREEEKRKEEEKKRKEELIRRLSSEEMPKEVEIVEKNETSEVEIVEKNETSEDKLSDRKIHEVVDRFPHLGQREDSPPKDASSPQGDEASASVERLIDQFTNLRDADLEEEARKGREALDGAGDGHEDEDWESRRFSDVAALVEKFRKLNARRESSSSSSGSESGRSPEKPKKELAPIPTIPAKSSCPGKVRTLREDELRFFEIPSGGSGCGPEPFMRSQSLRVKNSEKAPLEKHRFGSLRGGKSRVAVLSASSATTAALPRNCRNLKTDELRFFTGEVTNIYRSKPATPRGRAGKTTNMAPCGDNTLPDSEEFFRLAGRGELEAEGNGCPAPSAEDSDSEPTVLRIGDDQTDSEGDIYEMDITLRSDEDTDGPSDTDHGHDLDHPLSLIVHSIQGELLHPMGAEGSKEDSSRCYVVFSPGGYLTSSDEDEQVTPKTDLASQTAVENVPTPTFKENGTSPVVQMEEVTQVRIVARDVVVILDATIVNSVEERGALEDSASKGNATQCLETTHGTEESKQINTSQKVTLSNTENCEVIDVLGKTEVNSVLVDSHVLQDPDTAERTEASSKDAKPLLTHDMSVEGNFNEEKKVEKEDRENKRTTMTEMEEVVVVKIYTNILKEENGIIVKEEEEERVEAAAVVDKLEANVLEMEKTKGKNKKEQQEEEEVTGNKKGINIKERTGEQRRPGDSRPWDSYIEEDVDQEAMAAFLEELDKLNSLPRTIRPPPQREDPYKRLNDDDSSSDDGSGDEREAGPQDLSSIEQQIIPPASFQGLSACPESHAASPQDSDGLPSTVKDLKGSRIPPKDSGSPQEATEELVSLEYTSETENKGNAALCMEMTDSTGNETVSEQIIKTTHRVRLGNTENGEVIDNLGETEANSRLVEKHKDLMLQNPETEALTEASTKDSQPLLTHATSMERDASEEEREEKVDEEKKTVMVRKVVVKAEANIWKEEEEERVEVTPVVNKIEVNVLEMEKTEEKNKKEEEEEEEEEEVTGNKKEINMKERTGEQRRPGDSRPWDSYIEEDVDQEAMAAFLEELDKLNSLPRTIRPPPQREDPYKLLNDDDSSSDDGSGDEREAGPQDLSSIEQQIIPVASFQGLSACPVSPAGSPRDSDGLPGTVKDLKDFTEKPANAELPSGTKKYVFGTMLTDALKENGKGGKEENHASSLLNHNKRQEEEEEKVKDRKEGRHTFSPPAPHVKKEEEKIMRGGDNTVLGGEPGEIMRGGDKTVLGGEPGEIMIGGDNTVLGGEPGEIMRGGDNTVLGGEPGEISAMVGGETEIRGHTIVAEGRGGVGGGTGGKEATPSRPEQEGKASDIINGKEFIQFCIFSIWFSLLMYFFKDLL